MKLPSLRNVFRRKPVISKPKLTPTKPKMVGNKMATDIMGRTTHNTKINRTGVIQTYATKKQARAAYKAQQPKKPGIINRIKSSAK